MNLNNIVRAVILLLFFASTFRLLGQQISITDQSSGQPIEGVFVMVNPLQGASAKSYVSNNVGRVELKGLTFPILIQTQHVAYYTYTDTLYEQGPLNIELLPKENLLDDFVVTGQFDPRSVESSVFSVKVIDKEEFNARGAVNLAEALASSLNIRTSQDLAIGSTGLSLQGISSQNVKILIDGVPLVNRNGNGNAADLSQINLNNIERVEIVEGPMAVNYGANALAGVINLITIKTADAPTEINVTIHEETVGSEVGPGKGRHIQGIDIRHNLSEKWFTQIGALHTDFQGYQGSFSGRQKEWNPKDQLQTNLLLKRNGNNHSVYYRLDYLDELIQNQGQSNNNYLPSGENQPFAIDEEYNTQRVIHQIQAEGKLPFLSRYTAFASFSDFERKKSKFSENLVTGERQLTTASGDQDVSTYKVWEFGGSGYNPVSGNLDWQLGYQLNFEEVGGGRIQEGTQSINDIAFYSSLEWKPWEKTTLRPGVRLAINSVFGSQAVPSLQLKQVFNSKTDMRLSYGRGYRAPSVRELYFEFVDSNHRIFGNPNLSPEFSHHLSTAFSKRYGVQTIKAETEARVFYNNIKDQIGLAQSSTDATATTYINVDQFKTLGFNLSQQLEWRQLVASVGFSYIGRYNRLDDSQNDELKTFFYTPEINTSINKTFGASGVSVNLFYKYTGAVKNYLFSEDEEGEQQVTTGQLQAFHLMDLTLSKTFFSNLNIVLGAKNLFNIQRINNSGTAGGAHSGGSSVPVSYGRSYFIKLNYNLKLR